MAVGAARVTEQRKHEANNTKCRVWVPISTCGAKAMEFTGLCSPTAKLNTNSVDTIALVLVLIRVKFKIWLIVMDLAASA